MGGNIMLIDNEERGKRLARAVASDIAIYNEDKIIEGLMNDNVFDLLSEEIEKQRELYKSRVTPEVYQKNFFDQAIVDVLLKRKAHLKCKVW